MSSGSLRLRLLIAAAISIGFAFFMTGAAMIQLFEQQVRQRVLGDLENHMLQLAGLVEVLPDGKVRVARALADPRFQEPYGGRYWRIDFAAPGDPPPREALQSRSLWDADLDPVHPVGPAGEKLITASRQLTLDSKQGPLKLWLTIAAHEDEVQRPLGELREQLVLALTLIGIVLMIGAWIQVAVGLSPLKALRQRLAEVSSGAASKLTGLFPSEVAPLVEELNEVLEAREKSLERARRRAGDMAHGLKTPLTVLSAIARDLRRHDLTDKAAEIEEQADAMYRQVEQALARSRLSSGRSHRTTPLRPAIEKVLATLQRLPRGDEIDWEIEVDPVESVPIEAGDLTELLGNLLDNARKWAASRIRVSGGDKLLVIEDDGPGVPAADLGHISERGRRLDETKQGSGLGLSIVADIADIYGLSVTYGKSELGGLRVAIAD